MSSRAPAIALVLGLLATPAVASEPPSSAPPDAARQAENASPAPAAAASSAPASAPAATGIAAELRERLAADAGLAAAEREDRAALVKFYEARQQEPVWVGAGGLTPAAEAAIAEIRRADDWGLDASAFRLPALAAAAGAQPSRAALADAEIALGLAILKYARHARGGRAEPTSLSRNLDRKLTLLEPGLVIAAAAKAASVETYLRSLHPQHPQFEALRQKYLALKRGEPVALAEPAPAVTDKKGVKSKTPVAAPAAPDARRLLANMEQWRWMPDQLGDFHIWVNIPEYTVRVVKAGKAIHTERVIVGKLDTQTPVFSQDMEQVIFHPFWGIPESIKRADVLPSLRRGSSTLMERYNLRLQRGGRDVDPKSVDWSTADIRQFHVYQPPGPKNVLGVMKFRFPNKHDVYMHDTPTKHLFNAAVRTYSHGCVRVREPHRLAELVLAEDQGWPASRVAAAISGGPQNNQIGLGRKVPVHMTYFTAMVDDEGKLRLFADIYRHEQRIALGMEGKAHLVAQLVKEERPPGPADVVGRLADTTTGGGPMKKQWERNAFGAEFGNN